MVKGLDGSFSHPVLGPDQTLASGVDGVGRQGPVEAEDLSEAFGVPVLEVTWKFDKNLYLLPLPVRPKRSIC